MTVSMKDVALSPDSDSVKQHEAGPNSLLLLESALDKTALVCLGILILQISVSFLPEVVVLKYLTTTRLILFVGFASLASLRFIQKRQGSVGGSYYLRDFRVLFVPIALLLLWYGASSLINGGGASLSGFRLQLEEILAFYFVIMLIRDPESLRAVMFIFLVAISVTALHAVKQFVEYENTNFFLIYQGAWRAVEAITIPKGAIVRVSGYFNNPNTLATYLILLAPIAASFIRRGEKSNWVAYMLLGIAAMALMLTFSRAAIIALIIAVGIALLRKRPLYMLSIVTLILIVLGSPLSIGRSSTALSRIDAWSMALDMIIERPFFGVGPGNFRAVVLERTSANFWHAHNVFLHISAEAGIIAGILFFAIFIIAVMWALDISRKKSEGAALGFSLTTALVAFGVISMVDNTYNVSAISYTYWLLIGLLVAARRVYSESSYVIPVAYKEETFADLRKTG